MHELTDKEITLISREIDQQGLTYTLLKDELLDHICCEIEAEMESGLTFNEAYRKVKHIIGSKRIRQVQDETLFLINKKYRRMKKLMYVLGIAVPILIIIGAIFKMQHWTGAGILITLGLFTTGIIFLPVFVMVRIRDTRQQNESVPLGLYLTGMITGMVTITGTLFKIQHWPGAGVLISLGLFLLAVLFLPMFAVVKIRDARKGNKPLNIGFYITGVLAGILFIAGALFKVQHWPGAGYVIIVSWLLIAVLFLPLLLLNVLKQKENRVNNFFFIVLSVSFVAVLIMSLMRAPARSRIEGVIFSEESLASNAVFLDRQNDRQLQEALEYGSGEMISNMQAISEKADKICAFIQSAKTEMVRMAADENQAAIRTDDQIDFQHVIGNDSDRPSFIVMIGSSDRQGKAFELRSMLESFKQHALSFSANEDLKNFINEQISLTLPEGINKSWEEYYFTGLLIQTASNLSTFQLKIRMIESGLIRELSDQLKEE